MKASISRGAQALATFLLMFLVFSVFDVPSGSKVILLAYYTAVFALALLVMALSPDKKTIQYADILLMLLIIVLATLASFSAPDQALGTLVLFVFAILISLIIKADYERNQDVYLWALKALLVVHLVAFYIQFAVFFLFGKLLDIHTVIFFFSESHATELTRDSLFGARLTGLHNEPGTYATWIMPLVFLILFIEKKMSLLQFCAVVSLMLTFSVSGYIYAVLLLMASLFIAPPEKRGRYIIKVALGCSVSVFVFLSLGGYDYLMWRFFDASVIDGTSELKWISIRYLLEADYSRILLGSGLGVNDCVTCASLQDTGLAFNLIFQLGAMGAVIIVLSILFSKAGSLTVYIFVGALLLSKMFVFSLSFWISLGLLSGLRKNYRRRKVNY